MSKGDEGVVTRGCLIIKYSRRKSGASSLNGPAGVFIEGILTDDPYRTYQRVSW